MSYACIPHLVPDILQDVYIKGVGSHLDLKDIVKAEILAFAISYIHNVCLCMQS